MSKAQCRIGIDVGGTFTDFVLVNAATGATTFFKEPSVPADPSASVQRGISKVIAKAGVTNDDVELVIHGTTIGLNAIIQRRGARIALVVPRGFRDILEIARSRMPNSYDMNADKEQVLVPRDLVFEVGAAISAQGEVLARPDAAELDALAADLKASGVAAVAVTLLHAYLYPETEREIVAGLADRLPDVLVSAAAEIWPETREYERTLVALLNSYVHPLMTSYFTLLQQRLAGLGLTAPVYITSSNGGTLSIDTARDRPIDTVLSGPASGVVAAQVIAAQSGLDRIITFDMGGTSSDIAVTRNGDPEYTTRTHVGDFPLVLPVVNVAAIGAGGGSIIWVDEHGVLKVGPGSAGADPGPVCYGRGGTSPCVTDCYVAIGLIDPDRFLEGRMKLDRAAALAALAAVGARIGITGPDAGVRTAEAALQVATAVMGTELRKSLAQRGEDPRSFALMPFGGAGPTHANMLAAEVGLTSMIVPGAPGTFCAMGATLADIKRDYLRSLRHRATDPAATADLLARTLGELMATGRTWIAGEGSNLGDPVFAVTADLHYEGEAFDINVPAPADGSRIDVAALCEAFHQQHERQYGFRDPDSPIEIVTLRLRVTANLPRVPTSTTVGTVVAVPVEQRQVWHDGGYVPAAVYNRRLLAAGQKVAGPAVLEQEDTTTWLLPGWTVEVEPNGTLIARAA
ncbi:hydantoinase/oxoprolinase family protein [Gemmobacter sp.]|uniref:hydantoinase/oxoprolinase family protein n=1 Tax=Gemmobacter sp. TaxID=1898957 RepID=UPI002B001FCB|nr:hydantoinase/oxoprolinase family protein [Gemmobacter sp.]